MAIGFVIKNGSSRTPVDMDVRNLADSIVVTKMLSFVHHTSEFMVRNFAAQSGSFPIMENMAVKALAICVEQKSHVFSLLIFTLIILIKYLIILIIFNIN